MPAWVYTRDKMEKEKPKNVIRQRLQQIENSRASKPNPLEEALRRFDNVYQIQLAEAEKAFLEKYPITSIIEMVEESAHIIEEKEGFDWLNKQTYSKYGHEERKLKRTTKFNIEFIGYHGDDCYPKREDEGSFVQAIESGKQIAELIRGVRISYSYDRIRLVTEIGKDNNDDSFTVNWELGESDGILKIEGFDLLPFTELLANGIADKKYVDNRLPVSNWGGDWSLN